MAATPLSIGALAQMLSESPPALSPVLEVISKKVLSEGRLALELVDGQNIAKGVTLLNIPVASDIERASCLPLLIQIHRWQKQSLTTGQLFVLIQEARVLGRSANPVQPLHLHNLQNLSRRAGDVGLPLTQAIGESFEAPAPGGRPIAEMETQPGPVDNIYSRPLDVHNPPRDAGQPAGMTFMTTSPAPGAQVALSMASPGGNISVIRSLNAYTSGRWKIKARVLTKSDVRKFNNSRGEGQLFKVDLKDQSGEISATFFGRAVDKYYSMLKPGQVYTFCKGQVKTANKRYDTGDFVLSFEEHAQIEQTEEDQSIPQICYDFRPLADVTTLPAETLVDVKAVVYNVPAPFTFVAKTSNKEMTKREIGLWDPTGPTGHSVVELVLWNERALGVDLDVGAVVFLKKARVAEFNGQKSLSSPAQLEVNPDNQECFALVRSFQEFQATNPLPVPQKAQQSSGKIKTIEGCRQEDLNLAPAGTVIVPGATERAVHRHTVVATLQMLPIDRPPYYSSCPQQVEANNTTSRANAPATRSCNKKVVQENGLWRCSAGHEHDSPDFRFLSRINIVDHTDQLEVNLYDEAMQKLLGVACRDYVPIYEAVQQGGQREQELKELHRRMEWKRCQLTLRAQREVWQENERVRYSVDNAQLVSYEQEAKQMLADIWASLDSL